MTDFIDTKFTFLTDVQRQLLRDADLDSPEAFAHLTVGELVAAGLKLGTASKVLVAAGVKSSGADGPQTVVVTHAEPPDVSARIDRALQLAHDDPSKAGALVDLGVLQVVLRADDRIDFAATKAMRAHAATGAPVGETWQGQRIADTATLASPPVWCSPRTRTPLQAGVDERTGVPWGELKLDGLRLAAFGFQEQMFGGASDDAVFERLRDPNHSLRGKIEARMKAMQVTPESMDDVVIYQRPRPRDDLSRSQLRNGSGAPEETVVFSGRPLNILNDLFVMLFNEDEVRAFMTDGPDGTRARDALPGRTAPLATVAFAAADICWRWGLLGEQTRGDTMARLLRVRPRRADDIRRAFAAMGG